MTAWRKFVLKLVLFAALLWTAFALLDAGYAWSLRRGDFYKQQWVAGMRGEHVDLAILGSSRSYVTIDAAALASTNGWEVRNLSLDGSGLLDQMILLKLFLNKNRTDRLLLQVDHWCMAQSSDPDITVRFFLPYRRRLAVKKALLEHVALPLPTRLIALIPFADFARFNAYWSPDKLANSLFHLKTKPFDEFGSYLIDRSLDPTGKVHCNFGRQVCVRKAVLEEVLELCLVHEIELTLFTAPWAELRDPLGNRHHFSAFFQGLGVAYHDFSDTYRGQTEYFYDSSHLNRQGAQEFTALLQKTLFE